jgi:hypothetical protein
MFWQRLQLASWTCLVLLLGYFLGTFAMQLEEAQSPSPVIPLHRDIHRRAPIVHIEEINNGKIVGVVGTGARLVIGHEVIIPRPDRSFTIDAEPFLVNIIDTPVPPGMQFVASSRGKNYYPISSSAGQKLTPENRIYFRTEVEAERAGYKPGK